MNCFPANPQGFGKTPKESATVTAGGMENSKLKDVNLETAIVWNTKELAMALDSGFTCLYQGWKSRRNFKPQVRMLEKFSKIVLSPLWYLSMIPKTFLW